MFSPNITIGCRACLPNMYLYTSAHPVCTDMIRHQHIPARIKSAIIVILCALYCNVFSVANETWGNLTALHSILHQRRLSSCSRLVSGLPECVRVLWRRRGFAKWLCREGGDLAYKASLLLLAFPKSPTLPLKDLSKCSVRCVRMTFRGVDFLKEINRFFLAQASGTLQFTKLQHC